MADLPLGRTIVLTAQSEMKGSHRSDQMAHETDRRQVMLSGAALDAKDSRSLMKDLEKSAAKAVHSGALPQLSIFMFDAMFKRRFTPLELATTVIAQRTYARRAANQEPLSVDETDKALRFSRVVSLADRTFGAQDKAERWLRRPLQRLNGQTPLQMLRTDLGTREVEELLHQIDHGMFA